MESDGSERVSERELHLQRRIDDLCRQLAEARRTRGTPVQTIVEEDENVQEENVRLTRLQHELTLAREQIARMRDGGEGELKTLQEELARCKELLAKVKVDEEVEL